MEINWIDEDDLGGPVMENDAPNRFEYPAEPDLDDIVEMGEEGFREYLRNLSVRGQICFIGKCLFGILRAKLDVVLYRLCGADVVIADIVNHNMIMAGTLKALKDYAYENALHPPHKELGLVGPDGPSEHGEWQETITDVANRVCEIHMANILGIMGISLGTSETTNNNAQDT